MTALTQGAAGAATTLVGAADTHRIQSFRSGRKFFGAVGAVLLGYLVVVGARPGGTQFTMAFADGSLLAASVFGAVCAALTSRRMAGSYRAAWRLLSTGMAFWALGQLVWTYYELAEHWSAPFPSLADVGFLLSIPFLLIGTAMLSTARGGKLRSVLDGLLVSTSLFYVGWATVLEPIVQTDKDGWLGWAIGLAYPVGGVALVTTTLIVLSLAHPTQRRSIALLAVGAIALTVGAAAYAYVVNNRMYTASRFVDAGWVIGFVLMGLGAQNARSGPSRVEKSTRSSTLWLVLPYLPLALAIATAVIVTMHKGETGPFLHTIGGLIAVLVVARQLVGILDNLALTRQLAVAVEELRCREDELQHLAFHDSLTGLPNRALFHDRAEHAIAQQNRAKDPLAVLFVDLDGFKQVNDQLGHAAGDALLRAVADRLRECVRTSDTLARLGGDEFAVLAERMTTAEDVEVVAGRIVRTLEPSFDLNGHTARITASVGVVLRQPGPGGVEDMLRCADNAMYAAKAAGKGRYVIVPDEQRALAHH